MCLWPVACRPVGSTGSCEVEMKEEDVTRLEEEQDDADEKYLKLKYLQDRTPTRSAPRSSTWRHL